MECFLAWPEKRKHTICTRCFLCSTRPLTFLSLFSLFIPDPAYELLHVVTCSPVCLYTMKPHGQSLQFTDMYGVFPGLTRKMVRAAALGPPLHGQILLHEEAVSCVLNTLYRGRQPFSCGSHLLGTIRPLTAKLCWCTFSSVSHVSDHLGLSESDVKFRKPNRLTASIHAATILEFKQGLGGWVLKWCGVEFYTRIFICVWGWGYSSLVLVGMCRRGIWK